jgi:hypothetical protein
MYRGTIRLPVDADPARAVRFRTPAGAGARGWRVRPEALPARATIHPATAGRDVEQPHAFALTVRQQVSSVMAIMTKTTSTTTPAGHVQAIEHLAPRLAATDGFLAPVALPEADDSWSVIEI